MPTHTSNDRVDFQANLRASAKTITAVVGQRIFKGMQIRQLEIPGRTGLPLLFWDEHLTSMEAERLLAQRGVKAKDRKAKLDAAAAAVMLEDLLETRKIHKIPVGQFGS